MSVYNPLTRNRYGYVVNNPLNYSDPTGHRASAMTGAFTGASAVTSARLATKLINAAKAITSPSAAQSPIIAAKKSSAYRNAQKNQTNAQKAKNAASKIKSLTQRLREAHIKAFCTLDRAKVKTNWKSKIRNFAIKVRFASQLYTQRVSHNTGSLPGAGGLRPSKYASVILKGTKWYLDSHTMVPELVRFITSPLARGIAYSFLEAQGAVAIAGAIAFAPELAVGGPAGVAVDASIAAIGSLMFFAGDVGRRQAADDLAEEWSHNKSSTGESEYKAPEGGGGITDKIKVGNKEVSFGHGGRHLEGTGLSVKEVNQAIANDVVNKNLGTGQFYKGQIKVDGTIIEYTSYGVEDGVVNVGTYYPIK